MKSREEYRQRISLILLISICVFVVISVAVALAALTIYILIRLNVIAAEEENVSLGLLFLLIIHVSAIIGFILTFFTSRFSLKPVNQMINQMERLAKGDFSARIKFGNPIRVHPAFRDIEANFNKTAEELERTEMLQSDFINNFLHEFKTPIVSIAGFAKMLRVADLSDKKREDYLAVIEEESLRLSKMATNVLNLTRLENQTILTGVTEYNLSEQLRVCILMQTDMWTQNELELDIDFDEYMIKANKELMEQAWINLINNAIKFSNIGGTLSVGISENADTITVSITNGGSEIPAESTDRIFNKFYQADKSHSSEGNGIGLAIVKKVVDLHGGEVGVTSGGGRTTFTVCLPK